MLSRFIIRRKAPRPPPRTPPAPPRPPAAQAKMQQHHLRRLFPNLELLPSNYQIRGMHTILRDRTTNKNDVRAGGRDAAPPHAGALFASCGATRRSAPAGRRSQDERRRSEGRAGSSHQAPSQPPSSPSQ